MKPEKVRKILTRDGLDEAEKMTGASYKASKFTRHIGLLNHMEIVAEKKAAMLATDDTAYACPLDRYLRIAQEIGFKIVLVMPFKGNGWGREPVEEALYVLWKDGILLKFDTFGGNSVNSGNFYYNWRRNRPLKNDGLTSSGSCSRQDVGIWVGNHDCREALRFHLSQLEQAGSFLSKWIERPFLWLLHYGDTETAAYDYNAINQARIALFPEEVRNAITPSK